MITLLLLMQTLGIQHAFSSFIWLCGPITGFVVSITSTAAMILDANINQGNFGFCSHLFPIIVSRPPCFLRVISPLPYCSGHGVVCCLVVSFTEVYTEMDISCGNNSLGYWRKQYVSCRLDTNLTHFSRAEIPTTGHRRLAKLWEGAYFSHNPAPPRGCCASRCDCYPSMEVQSRPIHVSLHTSPRVVDISPIFCRLGIDRRAKWLNRLGQA